MDEANCSTEKPPIIDEALENLHITSNNSVITEVVVQITESPENAYSSIGQESSAKDLLQINPTASDKCDTDFDPEDQQSSSKDLKMSTILQQASSKDYVPLNINQQQIDFPAISKKVQEPYKLKQIKFKGRDLKILLQNSNGPCPLLALTNSLIIRGRVQIAHQTEINGDALSHILVDYLFSEHVREVNVDVGELFMLLGKFREGMQLNIEFDCVRGVEVSPSTRIFENFGIPIYHSWVISEREDAARTGGQILAMKSYDKILFEIMRMENGELAGDDCVAAVVACRQFLEDSKSQSTIYGLGLLMEDTNLDDGLPVAYFRNNHFSTMIKSPDGRVWSLVTDEWCAGGANVWESITVDGDSEFTGNDFGLVNDGAEFTFGSPEYQIERSVADIADEEYVVTNGRSLALAKRLQASDDAYRSQELIARSPFVDLMEEESLDLARKLQARDDAMRPIVHHDIDNQQKAESNSSRKKDCLIQ